MISLLTKTFSLKVTKAVILSIDTYEQDMIEVGNENKKIYKKDRWDHCNHILMQSLLGNNHRLPLFHISKSFIWLEESKERINEFFIGYMINPTFNIKRSFREQVNKCMKTKFGVCILGRKLVTA